MRVRIAQGSLMEQPLLAVPVIAAAVAALVPLTAPGGHGAEIAGPSASLSATARGLSGTG